MKNKKNTIVKKIVMTAITALVLVVSLAFSTNPNEQANLISISKASKDNTISDYKYFFVTGIRLNNEHERDHKIMYHFISNVVYLENDACNSTSWIGSEFDTFIRAYYYKKGISNPTVYEFKTRGEAINKRRERLAQYNNMPEVKLPMERKIVLVNDFTLHCD